jgi:hypothetical protein
MSELTDIFIQTAEQWGWGLLFFGFTLYQFYWPEVLHPTRTKLQQVFRQFHVFAKFAEAAAEELDSLNEERTRELLIDNGITADDFKTDPERDVAD